MRVVFTDPRFPDQETYSDLFHPDDEVQYGGCENKRDLLEACEEADIVVTRKAPIDREVIEAIGSAKLIMRNGTGYENIDVRAATARGIPVSNVPGYSNDEVATHAIALMLAAAHEIVYADSELRNTADWGDRRKYQPVHGGTLGIVGLGRIGRAIVPKARGLDMEVIAYDPRLPEELFAHLGVERCDWDGLLTRSDCISIHTHLTRETHHMFSAEEFERMKNAAILVNTARGGIVDDDALVDAVESGEIWGAGLDVFEEEPPNDSDVLSNRRIVCSPHHAAETVEADQRCIRIGRNEIGRALQDRPLRNVLNPEVMQYTEILDQYDSHVDWSVDVDWSAHVDEEQ